MGRFSFAVKKPPEWFTTYETPNIFDSSQNWWQVNVRILLLDNFLSVDGTNTRITLAGAPNPTGYLVDLYIGEKASGGDAWDFASTPTHVTWDGGSGTKNVSSNDVVSDEIVFTFDQTKDYIISFYFGGGAPSKYVPYGGDSEYTTYAYTGGNLAGQVNPTGYSALPAFLAPIALKKIEVN